MHIAGGVYGEFCHFPTWNQTWGSGGRAAFSVSLLLPKVELHTYAWNGINPVFEQTARANRISLHVHPSKANLRFEYWYPQSPATVFYDPKQAQADPFSVNADNVLRFGMLEGNAVIHARNAVYDPQNDNNPVSFSENGSTANRLALVLNMAEAKAMSGKRDPVDAAKYLSAHESANAVVIKCGPYGAYVVEGHTKSWVPCYKTPDVWPLGSGDVFSAVFAAFWTEKHFSAANAAKVASKATATYCASRSLPIASGIRTLDLSQHNISACKTPAHRRNRTRPKVYLASPFFRLGETWVVERVRESLTSLGFSVLSPLHDVGFGCPKDVAAKDLALIRKSDIVFAILGPVDAGTLFEIGYARSRGTSTVVFADHVQEHELTMLFGTGCEISTDLSTALYKAAWVAYGL